MPAPLVPWSLPPAAADPKPWRAGSDMAQLVCNNPQCRVVLMYPRGASQVQCSVCGNLNCAMQVSWRPWRSGAAAGTAARRRLCSAAGGRARAGGGEAERQRAEVAGAASGAPVRPRSSVGAAWAMQLAGRLLLGCRPRQRATATHLLLYRQTWLARRRACMAPCRAPACTLALPRRPTRSATWCAGGAR